MGTEPAANLAYTKFLFVMARAEDDAHGARLRTAGGNIARGFFNDFDIDDSRETQAQPFETIQFFVRDGELPEPEPTCVGPCINKARHLVQVSSKYRPRLQEIEEELRRRIGDAADVLALDGAVAHAALLEPGDGALLEQGRAAAPVGPRQPQRHHRARFARRPSGGRRARSSGTPISIRTSIATSACPVKGHAVAAAERGIPALFRRVYHNPDGYEREASSTSSPTSSAMTRRCRCSTACSPSLRDLEQNPEWQFVQEGPIWRGQAGPSLVS